MNNYQGLYFILFLPSPLSAICSFHHICLTLKLLSKTSFLYPSVLITFVYLIVPRR